MDLNRFLAQKGKKRLDVCLSCERNDTGKIPQVKESVPKTNRSRAALLTAFVRDTCKRLPWVCCSICIARLVQDFASQWLCLVVTALDGLSHDHPAHR